MAASAYTDTVQKIYIAYYGRAADPVGLAYWSKAIDDAGGSLDAIMTSFGTSAEATTLYGSLDNSAKVNAIFQQSFGRDADFTGLMYYSGQLSAGTMTASSIAQNIFDGAKGTDATTLANKLVVAKAYTAAIDTAAEVVAYAGTVAAASARTLLSTVDSTTTTLGFDVATSIAGIVSTANGTTTTASTISLTAGTDTGAAMTGTSGADQFNAFLGQNSFSGGVSNTLSSADSLDGGAGTDSLYAQILPEFYGTSATTDAAKIDIQPRTSSIENIQFEARETKSSPLESITVDAKNMIDVVEIGSYLSDGNLVIENLTTQSSSGNDRNTVDLTITMDHTDNFNSDDNASDLTVYFDEDYLLTGQTTSTSQANYWLLDQNSEDYGAKPLDLIERTGVTFTIADVTYSVTMADTIAAAANDWDAFAAGLQTVITDRIAAGETAFVGLTVAVDLDNTRTTFNDAGDQVTIPAITITDAAGRAIVPTGYTAPAVVSADFNIYGQFDDVASAVTSNPLAINVDLHKVGREGEGGNLLIGGKELDSDGGAATAGNGIGIFNIDVLGAATKLSNLGSINSSNNALTTVNIATHADFTAGATHASLTVRDAFGTTAEDGTVTSATSMETVDASAFLGALNIGQDTRALNIDTFTANGGGIVTYRADINGAEKGTFATTTGSAADVINMTLDGDAVDTTGTSFAINSGGDADTITVSMIEGGVSVATTALLDNLSISSGAGADTITLVGGSNFGAAADGDADFNIASGAGSDMVNITTIGDVSNSLLAFAGADAAAADGFEIVATTITDAGGTSTFTTTFADGADSTAVAGTASVVTNVASTATYTVVAVAGGVQITSNSDIAFTTASTTASAADVALDISAADTSSITDAASTGSWVVGVATGAPTFEARVLYEATLTVNFAGFEETVTVATNAAGNFVATQLDINAAIKAAIAANPELAQLLTTTDGTSAQQLTITSTVEGDNDCTVTLVQPNVVEVGAVAGTSVNLNVAHIDALEVGFIATTGSAYLVGNTLDSDTITTGASVVTVFDGTSADIAAAIQGNLENDGGQGAALVVVSADAGLQVDGTDDTIVTNVSTIDMGTGANDLVVLNSHDSSASTLDFSAAWGKVSVVNFFDNQGAAEGEHILDFTAWLDDQTDASAAADVLSAVRIGTTLDTATGVTVADATYVSNEVRVINNFVGTATETWAGLTATDFQTALNDDTAGANAATDYATLGTGNAVTVTNLIGTTIDTIIMIENDLNAGEYKVFNAEISDLGGVDTFAVTLVGTVDFGYVVDAPVTLA